MAIDADDPVDARWDFGGDIAERRDHLRDLCHALGRQVGGAGVEQHLGGEDEAVAHHAHAFAPGKDLRQLAEEFRTVAGQFPGFRLQRFRLFLQPYAFGLFQFRAAFLFRGDLRKGRIQPRPQRVDLHLGVGIARLGRIEKILKRAKLHPQRRDLLVQQRDLAFGRRRGRLFL